MLYIKVINEAGSKTPLVNAFTSVAKLNEIRTQKEDLNTSSIHFLTFCVKRLENLFNRRKKMFDE